MHKGVLIAKGRTAEVFEWQKDKVLKLFYDWIPQEHISYEAEIGKAVYGAGVSAPFVHDIIEEFDRKGILYERVYGESMLKLLFKQPSGIIYNARLMAKIQAGIHSKTASDLPKQKDRFESAVKDAKVILGDKATLIIDYMNNLPDGNSICHGDFHPDNIIVTDDKPVVIDWNNAYIGYPLSDVARTCLMINFPSIPPDLSLVQKKLLKIFRKVIYKAYIKEYMKISNVCFEDIDEWLLPIAAARLSEKVPGEKEWLLDFISERM